MYVQRDASLKITGAYANLQPGYAEEWLADSDPSLVAFLKPVVPDVPGFITEAKAALGGIVAASKISGAQAVFLALQSGNFADAAALIVDSHANALLGGLSDAQYAGIKSLVAKYHVPLTLP